MCAAAVAMAAPLAVPAAAAAARRRPRHLHRGAGRRPGRHPHPRHGPSGLGAGGEPGRRRSSRGRRRRRGRARCGDVDPARDPRGGGPRGPRRGAVAGDHRRDRPHDVHVGGHDADARRRHAHRRHRGRADPEPRDAAVPLERPVTASSTGPTSPSWPASRRSPVMRRRASITTWPEPRSLWPTPHGRPLPPTSTAPRPRSARPAVRYRTLMRMTTVDRSDEYGRITRCGDWLTRLLSRSGYEGEDLREAWAIVMRESGGREDAVSATGDLGLFQINTDDVEGRGLVQPQAAAEAQVQLADRPSAVARRPHLVQLGTGRARAAAGRCLRQVGLVRRADRVAHRRAVHPVVRAVPVPACLRAGLAAPGAGAAVRLLRPAGGRAGAADAVLTVRGAALPHRRGRACARSGRAGRRRRTSARR